MFGIALVVLENLFFVLDRQIQEEAEGRALEVQVVQVDVGEAVEGLVNQVHLRVINPRTNALQSSLHVFRVKHSAKEDQEVACEAADLILLHGALLRFVPLASVFEA